MSDDPASSAGRVRLASRLVLWLHALVWVLFAGGMTIIAVTSPEAGDNPVFLQVMLASTTAAIGGIGAAFYRWWGVVLALLGGLGVIVAWIFGDSGNGLRLPVGIVTGIFALVVTIERRAFITPDAR